jgi:uncharacterized protein (DUF1499 family)
MAEATSSPGGLTRFMGIAGAVGLIGGPLLARFGVIPPLGGFVVFALGGLLGLLTLIGGVIRAVRRGTVSAGPALVLGLVLTGIFMVVALPGRNYPRINDITTDPVNVPQFVIAGSLPGNEGRDMRYPGPSFAEQQRAGYPTLAGLKLSMPPEQAFQRVVLAAREMPTWEITRNDAAARTLEGVATSKWFRFKDDFVIEVRPLDGGSIVEMRSKSRDGKGDIGANAKRIQTFFAKLQA